MRIILLATRENVVEIASKLDFEIVLFENKERITKRMIQLSNETYIVDWENQDKIVKLAQFLHSEKKIDAIVAFGEKGVVPASLIKEKLNIIGNPYRPVYLSKNKEEMRKILNHNKQSDIVRYEVAKNEKHLKQVVKNIGFPCILKPLEGTASEGVFKVENEDQFKNSLVKESSYPLIIEEYLEGEEFSVECISFNGEHQLLGVTKKFTTGAPSFIEKGHLFPADLSTRDNEKIEQVVFNVLNVIGHQFGPSHTEVMITKNDIKIIETHTRPGGDSIPTLVKLSTANDLFYLTLKALKNNEIPKITNNTFEYSSIKFFLWANGQVHNIQGTNFLQSHPNIVESEMNIKLGENIQDAKSSLNRHGYVIYTGDSYKKLKEIEALIEENVFVELR